MTSSIKQKALSRKWKMHCMYTFPQEIWQSQIRAWNSGIEVCWQYGKLEKIKISHNCHHWAISLKDLRRLLVLSRFETLARRFSISVPTKTRLVTMMNPTLIYACHGWSRRSLQQSHPITKLNPSCAGSTAKSDYANGAFDKACCHHKVWHVVAHVNHENCGKKDPL